MAYIIDFAKNLEQSADQLKPILLICAGIAAVIIGLIIWLAGSAFKKTFFAIIGLVLGAIFGYVFSEKNINHTLAFAAAGAIILAIIGLILSGSSISRRLLSALIFSVFGSAAIFAGLILLLLYKGSQPVTNIIQKQHFFAAVFVAMAVSGTVEQLLFCKSPKKHLKNEQKKCKDS